MKISFIKLFNSIVLALVCCSLLTLGFFFWLDYFAIQAASRAGVDLSRQTRTCTVVSEIADSQIKGYVIEVSLEGKVIKLFGYSSSAPLNARVGSKIILHNVGETYWTLDGNGLEHWYTSKQFTPTAIVR